MNVQLCITSFLAFAIVILFNGCYETRAEEENLEKPPYSTYSLSGLDTLFILDSIIIQHGYGSSIARHPSNPDLLYILTDRGPNYDSPIIDGHESKGFAIPDYTPRVGLFEIVQNRLELQKVILLKDSLGQPITGLPKPISADGTGEIPVDLDKKILNFDSNGIDPEGLAIMNDGSFWISEEYGPDLLHFDVEGYLLEVISTHRASDKRSLPNVLYTREPNSGMEGLAVTPDQKYLVGVMQSPLLNTINESSERSRTCRITYYDLESGDSKQYLYIQDSIEHSNSALTAITDSILLVVERDGLFPYHPLDSLRSRTKKVYKINISNATDVADPTNGKNGLIVNKKTLEEMTLEELLSNGIYPVQKKLVLDLLDSPLEYLHDKPEGIFYYDQKVGIINDNDFGITSDLNGNILNKYLSNGWVDQTRLVICEVEL